MYRMRVYNTKDGARVALLVVVILILANQLRVRY